MTTYRARSAEVLNEADAFERRLNWTLFTMEQDQLLWGENPKVDWVPGDYIHPDPRDDYRYHLPWTFSIGFEGNFVRPMIEEFRDGDKYKPMRCQDCQVSWQDDSVCWMCGQTRPLRAMFSDFETIGYISDHNPRPRGLTLSRDEMDEYILRDLERTRDLMMQMRAPARRASENIEEMARVIDEFTTTRFDWHAHIQLLSPVRIESPRQRGRSMFLDEMQRFWSSTPPAPEPVTILGHEMPENWDDPTPPIPLPDMPPPRDFSEWRRGYSSPNDNRFRFFDS